MPAMRQKLWWCQYGPESCRICHILLPADLQLRPQAGAQPGAAAAAAAAAAGTNLWRGGALPARAAAATAAAATASTNLPHAGALPEVPAAAAAPAAGAVGCRAGNASAAAVRAGMLGRSGWDGTAGPLPDAARLKLCEGAQSISPSARAWNPVSDPRVLQGSTV